MLKIVVTQEGQPDREVLVPGNKATVGRVAPCDVVIDQPSVSKQHLQIFHGTVVFDMGSSNGTFIDGRRLSGADLTYGSSVVLSQQAAHLHVEVQEDEDATMQSSEGDGAGGSSADPDRARLVEENENLRERLESMKRDLESREVEDGGSVQAKLAMQRVERIQVLNDKLQSEVDHLRAQASTSEDADGSADALEASLREVRELQAELDELRAAAADAQEEKTPDFFFKLQADNAELKRKLKEATAGPPSGDAPSGGAGSSKHVKELMEARLRITALEAELSYLRVAEAPSADLSSAPAASASKAKKKSKAGGAALCRILQAFSDDDVEGLSRPTGGPPEEFLLIESLRLLRQMERVVTRVAGDLIQLFRVQTMLPDTVGTYRDHVAILLQGEDDPQTRANTIEYLETLGRWLVASIGAHRKAAILFAAKIKEDLSEKGLTAGTPLPSFAKVPMLAGSELWKRSQEYLLALSPDTIDERIDEIAREQAQKLLSENA